MRDSRAAEVLTIEPDTASLVARARNGDVSAFEAVYRLHCQRVFTVCVQLTADRGEAEELAQDAWVRAWKRIDSFRGDATFGTWMHRLTVNLVLDRKRRETPVGAGVWSRWTATAPRWGGPLRSSPG